MSTSPESAGSDTNADHPLDRGLETMHDLLVRREVSPTELCQEAFQRLREWDHLNAFTSASADLAGHRAGELELHPPGSRHHGSLWGVPIAIKDNIDVEGLRTTAGSSAVDYTSDVSATSAERLLSAGAVVVGKTNLPELAYGPIDTYAYGPTWNPWGTDRFAGGSSMGSGAAVAAGIVPAAIGSDTTGSVRNPAGWCGITGLKPTRGLVPNTGMVPLALSLDHIGPMARSALDCAVVLDVVAGYDQLDPRSRHSPRAWPGYAQFATFAPHTVRIGVVHDLFSQVNTDAAVVMQEALADLAGLGAELIDVEVPLWEDTAAAAMRMVEAEAAICHEDLLATSGGMLQPEVRARLEDGMRSPASDYVEAVFMGREFTRQLGIMFEQVDFLALPSRERSAPPMEEWGRRPPGEKGHLFNTPFNLAGSPALVMPAGLDPSGLPVGLQLAAGWWQDAALLRMAHAFQSCTPWHTLRPPHPRAGSHRDVAKSHSAQTSSVRTTNPQRKAK